MLATIIKLKPCRQSFIRTQLAETHGNDCNKPQRFHLTKKILQTDETVMTDLLLRQQGEILNFISNDSGRAKTLNR